MADRHFGVLLRGEGPRGAAKRSIRWVGTASSIFRPLPDFLIIGAKRGGTTSFYFDLLEHPAVLTLFPSPIPGLKPEPTKGVHYFDSNYFRGDRWYRSYMPTAATRAVTARREGVIPVAGEASPFYLFHPAAAERAHETVPEAKIIALLRDPVMRTYSHWKERRRGNAETLMFDEALAAEPARLAGERGRLLSDPAYTSYPWEQQSYATQSMYADALRPWIELFGRSHVFATASEDYYADPGRILGDVHEFLGLPRREKSTMRVRNAAPGCSPLPQHLRASLRERFAGPNRDLCELTGQEFPWR